MDSERETDYPKGIINPKVHKVELENYYKITLDIYSIHREGRV